MVLKSDKIHKINKIIDINTHIETIQERKKIIDINKYC